MHSRNVTIHHAGALALAVLLGLPAAAAAHEHGRDRGHEREGGRWVSGDFHQHTLYTDGSTPFDYVMSRNDMFGLDWWANSEHGGARNRDGNGSFWDDPARHAPGTILGDLSTSGGHRNMWRWQSLRDFAFPDVLAAREAYPRRRVFSGLEWNVPGHEHCSTAIVARDGSAISAFEFMFDASDTDTSRIGEVTPFGPLAKVNGRTYPGGASKAPPDRHADAVAACAWMQAQLESGTIEDGWIVFAHVERAGPWTAASGGGYNVEHFRDFNNAGPDVCFGFEGAPGHQVNEYRGLGNVVTCDPSAQTCTSRDFGGTYGGVGFYTAKVGGLWDALLGEGRRWYAFANSDYHAHHTIGGDDFFPGEYQKQWVFARAGDRTPSLEAIAGGLRSGRAFFAHGDLVDALELTVTQGRERAEMGGTLVVEGRQHRRPVELTIRFRTPPFNNLGARPAVDHVDLIGGEVTGLALPGTPAYANPANPTAAVLASFKVADHPAGPDGFHTITWRPGELTRPMYFRVRGTNLGCGVAGETGPAMPLPSPDHCAPLADALTFPNTALKAFADLWFYSNPVFVELR